MEKTKMRHLIIGDIHGTYDELMKLLEKAKYDSSSDKLISCGDLVEKGPFSHKVVEFFRRTPNTIVVKGNHEEALIRFWNHEQKKLFEPKYKNPMRQDQERIDACKQMTKEDIDYLKSLPYFYRFEVDNQKYLVIHAGIFPNSSPEEMDPNILCRLRYIRKLEDDKNKMIQLGKEDVYDKFWAELWNGPEFIFYGHAATDGHPREHKMAICCDWGNVYGFKLTLYSLEEKRYISVDCPHYSPRKYGEMPQCRSM